MSCLLQDFNVTCLEQQQFHMQQSANRLKNQAELGDNNTVKTESLFWIAVIASIGLANWHYCG